MVTWAKSITTRKLHECWGCGKKIKSGRRARYVTTVDDGFHHAYYCEVCVSILDHREIWECDEGISQGDVYYGDRRLWVETALELREERREITMTAGKT